MFKYHDLNFILRLPILLDYLYYVVQIVQCVHNGFCLVSSAKYTWYLTFGQDLALLLSVQFDIVDFQLHSGFAHANFVIAT